MVAGSLLTTAAVAVGVGCVGDDVGAGAQPAANDSGPPDANGNAPDSTTTPTLDGGASADASDAAVAECDLTKPFSSAVIMPGINQPDSEDEHASLTADELTIVFGTTRLAPAGSVRHVFTSTRLARNATFPTPIQLGAVFSANGDTNPSISADGTLIVWNNGAAKIFMATRMSAAEVFATPVQLSTDSLVSPNLTGDSSAIYAADLGSGQFVRLPKAGATFGAPAALAGVTNDAVQEGSPMSRDDLSLYFATARTGTKMNLNVWVHARANTTAAYAAATEVTSLSSDSNEAPSWLSPDGCRMYLTFSSGTGKRDIYLATRPK